jgi:hypothetical protein
VTAGGVVDIRQLGETVGGEGRQLVPGVTVGSRNDVCHLEATTAGDGGDSWHRGVTAGSGGFTVGVGVLRRLWSATVTTHTRT